MVEQKIDLETANVEFHRFIDMMDIDLEIEMDAESQDNFNKHKQRLIKAIQNGSLCINDKGEPIFTPQRSGDGALKLTFYEPNGTVLMALDKRKESEPIAKSYSCLGAWTRTSPAIFGKMMQKDLEVCTAITTIFLG